jgi:hypothetical protein
MKDYLSDILAALCTILLLLPCLWVSEPEQEPPPQQGLVQTPTLVEIPKESVNTEVGDNTEEIILSPQTGGFFIEILTPRI